MTFIRIDFENFRLVDFVSTKGNHRVRKLVNAYCECGNVRELDISIARGNTIKSCKPCAKIKRMQNRKHGAYVGGKESREHEIWCSMMKRCYNKNHMHYHNYGGRGIEVCESWKTFENFQKDMGLSDGKSLERINNNQGYFLENCKWANQKEQGNNRRTNVNVTILGVTKTMQQWFDISGVPKTTASKRLKRGMELRDVFDTVAMTQWIAGNLS